MKSITFPTPFKYHRGANAPEWFDKSDPYHYDITSGSSPFNEWYAFENDEDVHELAHSFESQSFIDGFIFVVSENIYYHFDDVVGHLNDDKCSYHYTPKEGTSPADARSMLEAESPF